MLTRNSKPFLVKLIQGKRCINELKCWKTVIKVCNNIGFQEAILREKTINYLFRPATAVICSTNGLRGVLENCAFSSVDAGTGSSSYLWLKQSFLSQIAVGLWDGPHGPLGK